MTVYTGQVKRVLSAIGVYATWRAWLVFLAFISTHLIALIPSYTPRDNFGFYIPWWQWIWGNFDGVVFMSIAEDGYSAGQVPFFPLYPILIRVFSRSTQIVYLQSALIVSAIFFALALYFCYQLLKFEKKLLLWPLFFLLVLCFPTAYHYTAVYNDSLFFALASAALLFTRKRRFFWAGVLGALATLARLNGLALFGVMILEYVLTFVPDDKTWSLKAWITGLKNSLHPMKVIQSGILFALLIPLAFMGYLYFIHWAFGDWKLFFKGVEVWHRDRMVFPAQTFWRYFKIIFIHPRFTFVYVIACLEAFFAMLYTGVLVFSFRKIHPVPWLMMLGHWLIPAVTGTFQGMPRYGLHLFPFFYCLALFLEKKPKWLQRTALFLSLCLQIFFVVFFTRGYFVT